LAKEIEPRQMTEPMNDRLPTDPQNHDASPVAENPSGPELIEPAPQQVAPPLAGDPISYAAVNFQARPALSYSSVRLPDDLRISWSWFHLLLFIFAGLASLFVVPTFVAILIAAYSHKSQLQLQRLFTNPGFLVATQVLWFAAVFLFLYVTLGVLRGAPFWQTLGWRKISATIGQGMYKPWMFFISGSGLAIFVALGSSRVKNADKAPIEELFKDPHAAMLLMAMAVFIAPLVEETVFRGYLYPLFASKLSKLAGKLGVDSARAVRFGTSSGILITGFLFGMMHGSQLGWNLGLVGMLTFVGIIFTFARAATGTVLASFLMHLGYNSLIAVSSIIATHGFQHAPPGAH
jgi:membrane protease YdiL (CAAX protease family)